VQPDLQDLSDATNDPKRHAVEVTPLDPRVRRVGDAGLPCDIPLPPSKTQPQLSERPPEPKIVHVADREWRRFTAAYRE
jgi:hypothetical protein